MTKLEKWVSAEIIISGPGMSINAELFLIKKMLETEGYLVSVKNDHSIDEIRYDEKELQRLRDLRSKNQKHHKVNIIMKHQPWGG